MSEELDDVQWEFLVEGLDDYVGLWQWVARVRRRSPDLEAEGVSASGWPVTVSTESRS